MKFIIFEENFKSKRVLSPHSTKYELLEDILISNNFIDNRKKFDKLISNTDL
jgi:hypothetical protein